MAERDVGEAEAAMPEEDRLVLAHAPRLGAADDLAELTMQRRLGELPRLDMGAQGSEHAALALSPIVDDQLVHDVGQRQLDRAHRAVRDDETALLDPFGLQERRWLLEARGLDDDIGVAQAALPILGHDHRLAEVARQRRGEGVATLLAPGMDPDLREIEEMI